MRSQEFTTSDNTISPQLQQLIDAAAVFGNKMAASKKFSIQLHVPRLVNNIAEDLKPQAELWTSTAIKYSNGYTSKWVQWCAVEVPHWITSRGKLYQIQPGAKILYIGSDATAIKIAKILGHTFPSHYARLDYPWQLLKEHFDAVYYPARLGTKYRSRHNNILMSMWSVESTAWYNIDKLRFLREVSVKVI